MILAPDLNIQTYLLTYSGTLSESPGLFPYLRSQGVEVVSAVAHQATRQVAVCARRDDLNAANIDGSEGREAPPLGVPPRRAPPREAGEDEQDT